MLAPVSINSKRTTPGIISITFSEKDAALKFFDAGETL
jgi:hypothetical protein